MKIALHRYVNDGRCYCLACWPDRRNLPCEDTRVLPKARAYVSCSACGAREEVAEDRTPESDGAAFRRKWAKEVAEGKALPSAGDLFDGEKA